jgi:nucleoid-associated protein YgaU
MGFFDFVKNAGESLFGGPKESDEERAAKLENRVRKLGLSVEGLKVDVDGETATVSGTVSNQVDRQKVVLAVGNTDGIGRVDDKLKVEAQAAEAQPAASAAEAEAKFYTVVKGDTLSKIAKEFYGDAMKYPVIFEANKPMLTDPDKIYPGQLLRIPPQES